MMKERRIKKEIEKDWKNNSNNIRFIDFKKNIATFFLYINENYHCTVVFNFKNIDYPFVGPKVFINNYSYLSILKTDTKSFKKNITSVNCCLYCESILCYDNWRATFTMKHILDEIYDNLILKLRMNEIRHCRKIVEKCLKIDYVPIEEFL